MGIWDLSKEELDEFIRSIRGECSAEFPPPASWWSDVPSFLDAGKLFIEIVLLALLYLMNFYLWWDVFEIISNFNY